LVAAVAGGFIGKTVDGWRDDYLAERDAVLRHYIELHPEDFPDPGKLPSIMINSLNINSTLFVVRQTYAQVMMPWVPIR